MHLLGWILFGFLVGVIARAIMPGKDPMGFIGTTVLGILSVAGRLVWASAWLVCARTSRRFYFGVRRCDFGPRTLLFCLRKVEQKADSKGFIL